jgi:hypothetical protein
MDFVRSGGFTMSGFLSRLQVLHFEVRMYLMVAEDPWKSSMHCGKKKRSCRVS